MPFIDRPKFSVNVLCHRRSDRARAVLDSLEKSDLRAADVTIFVDGPAHPGQIAEVESVVEVAQQYGLRNHWEIIQSAQNAGLRFATPDAMQRRLESGHEWLLTLEDDVEVSPKIGGLLENLIDRCDVGPKPVHYSLIDLVADEVSYECGTYSSPIPDSHAWLANQRALSLYRDRLVIPYRGINEADLSPLTKVRLFQLLLMVRLGIIESWAFRYTACFLRCGMQTEVVRGAVLSSLNSSGSNTFLADRKGGHEVARLPVNSIQSLNQLRFDASWVRVMLFAPEFLVQSGRRMMKIFKAKVFRRHPDLPRVLKKGLAHFVFEIFRFSRRTVMMKGFSLLFPKVDRSTLFVGSEGCRWPVPLVAPSDFDSDLKCVSIGLGNDIEVEDYLFRNGWKLNLFDPTPGVKEWVAESLPDLEEFVILEAVSDFDGIAEFFAPSDSDQVSHSLLRRSSNREAGVEVAVVDVAGIISMDTADVTLLKMDVEGVELKIIERLAQVGKWPRWIAFEIDEPLSLKKMKAIRRVLVDAGFRCSASANSNFLFER